MAKRDDEVQVFIDDQAHYRKLLRLAEGAKTVAISTFGIFWHRRGGEWNGAYTLCERLPENSRILVGIGGAHIAYQTENVGVAAGRFQRIEIRTVPEWHAKFTLFEMKDGTFCTVAGSRNLTPSGWADVTFLLPGKTIYKSLLGFFNQGWRDSDPVKEITGKELEALQNAPTDRVRPIHQIFDDLDAHWDLPEWWAWDHPF